MEWVSGNIFIRPNRLENIGDKVDGHKHRFDHTTIVLAGAVHVKTKDREGDFEAPAHFLVRKDVEHEITATKPQTVFWCVYSHHTPQGEVSQVYDGWMKAYG